MTFSTEGTRCNLLEDTTQFKMPDNPSPPQAKYKLMRHPNMQLNPEKYNWRRIYSNHISKVHPLLQSISYS